MSDVVATYRVDFERIGRHRDLQPQHFKAANADDLAAQVHDFADHYLGSTWFDVLVDLEEACGSIEAGRFGRFTISEVTA